LNRLVSLSLRDLSTRDCIAHDTKREPISLATEKHAIERRAIVRTRVDASGGVLPLGQFTLLPCDVLDLTDRGARLDVGRLGAQLGDEFDFSFDKFRTIRKCRLVWQRASFVGVSFIK
jgi:hypothetical protein